MTWSGEEYEFHGGCDLVLFSNPDFANGLGMDLYIRTKIKTWWSYIDTAVLRIGKDTFEVRGGEKDNTYWTNGEIGAPLKQGDTVSATLSGYKIHFRWMQSGQRRFRVDLGNGDAVLFKTFQEWLRVNVIVKNSDKFLGSQGLMGNFPDGAKVGRDNSTVFTDTNKFGLEWQVREEEPVLFHSKEGVQHPKACPIPSKEGMMRVHRRRRLGEAAVSEDDATRACAEVEDYARDLCVKDVLNTDSLAVAYSY